MADQAHDAAARGDMTRGQFLTASTVAVGGVMGALIAVPVAGMALAPVFGGDDFERVLLGKVDEFEEGVFTKVVLQQGADKPDAYVRKKVAFVRLNSSDAPDELAIEGQEKFSVVSNTCMHLGCPVQASSSGLRLPVPRRLLRQGRQAPGRAAGAPAGSLHVGRATAASSGRPASTPSTTTASSSRTAIPASTPAGSRACSTRCSRDPGRVPHAGGGPSPHAIHLHHPKGDLTWR